MPAAYTSPTLDPTLYAAAYGDLSAAVAVTQPVLSNPFPTPADNDDATYVHQPLILKQDFMQTLAAWKPLAIGTKHPEFSAFNLAEESDRLDQSGGVVRWTRTYIKTPPSRTEGRAIVWQLPGLGAGGSNPILPVTNVSGLSASNPPNYFNPVTLYWTVAGGSFSAGDKVVLFLGQMFSNYRPQFVQYANVISAAAGNITIYQGSLQSNPVTAIQKVSTDASGYYGRLPRQLAVAAKVVFDYFESDDPGTIDILNPPVVRNGMLQITDPVVYSYDGTPSLAQYVTMINAGTYIVAEPSQIRRWMGRVWERETTYVKAQ